LKKRELIEFVVFVVDDNESAAQDLSSFMSYPSSPQALAATKGG
jgi:hypothetical protein